MNTNVNLVFSGTGNVVQTVTTNARAGSSDVFGGTLSVSWCKLSDKARLIRWDAIDSTAGATNNPQFVIDTTTAFGTFAGGNSPYACTSSVSCKGPLE